MPYMIPPHWIDAAFSGGTLEAGGKTHRFALHAAGDLDLPSGRLIAADPFVPPYSLPYAVQVAPGRYRVELAVSQVSPDDQRVAFARIVFAPGDVTQWRMIAAGGDDTSALGDTEIMGFGVDAGTACYMSPEAAALLAERIGRDEVLADELGKLMERSYRPTWSSVAFSPGEEGSPGVVVFSSGYGDGVYASYLGTGADGHALCVVTDFAVLADEPADNGTKPPPPAAKPWWQFWG